MLRFLHFSLRTVDVAETRYFRENSRNSSVRATEIAAVWQIVITPIALIPRYGSYIGLNNSRLIAFRFPNDDSPVGSRSRSKSSFSRSSISISLASKWGPSSDINLYLSFSRVVLLFFRFPSRSSLSLFFSFLFSFVTGVISFRSKHTNAGNVRTENMERNWAQCRVDSRSLIDRFVGALIPVWQWIGSNKLLLIHVASRDRLIDREPFSK